MHSFQRGRSNSRSSHGNTHTDIRGRGRILGLHTEIVPVHVIHVRLVARLLTSASPIEAIQDSDIPLNQLHLVHIIVVISVAQQTISSLFASNGLEHRETQPTRHLVHCLKRPIKSSSLSFSQKAVGKRDAKVSWTAHLREHWARCKQQRGQRSPL